MKVSWGYKILFIYLAFVAGIMFLVFKANGERYDLVTENYYEQELKYQEVIDQKSRVDQLSAPLVVKHTANNLSIEFPVEFSGKSISGECYLYRPSDETKDLRNKFNVSNGQLLLQFPGTVSGMYELKLSWHHEGRDYFFEKKIFF